MTTPSDGSPEGELVRCLARWAAARMIDRLDADVAWQVAAAFAMFAFDQAQASDLPAAKVLCRLDDFAAAEWRDFCARVAGCEGE